MRPLYETDKNRADEAAACEEFLALQRPGLVAVKLPEQDNADYALYRDDRLVGIIEIKCRSNRHNAYAEYMLSRYKVDQLCRRSYAQNVPVAVVVKWADKIGFIDVHRFRDHAVLGTGGRKDRGDRLDMEKVYKIPFGLFSFPADWDANAA